MGHRTTKIEFTNRKGEKVPLTIDNDLKDALDWAKQRNKRNWDYVSIVAGLPGSGKSVFAKNTCAPYCCPWFSERYIAFTDRQFIKITTQCRPYSAVMLDESFASLNSRMIFTPEFQRIINHIQLIRQKRLFVFMCLPNFFDLAKGIAIFRASHLFVPYENKEGRRGDFLAFGKKEKRELYVLGSKFMDYGAVTANFHGRFFKNSLVVDEELYEKRKKDHLLEQDPIKKKKLYEASDIRRDIGRFMFRLQHPELEGLDLKPFSLDLLSKVSGYAEKNVSTLLKNWKERANVLFPYKNMGRVVVAER